MVASLFQGEPSQIAAEYTSLFEQLKTRDPQLYEYVVAVLQHELMEHSEQLSGYRDPKTFVVQNDQHKHRAVLRELWRVSGTLMHGIDYDVLTRVMKKFEREDTVPMSHDIDELKAPQQ